MLDRVRGTHARLVGVEPELLVRATLTQEIPVTIELDTDLLEASVLSGGVPALASRRGKQLPLLGDECLDVVLHLAIVHRPSYGRRAGSNHRLRAPAVSPHRWRMSSPPAHSAGPFRGVAPRA